jgi:hypothetical protein
VATVTAGGSVWAKPAANRPEPRPGSATAWSLWVRIRLFCSVVAVMDEEALKLLYAPLFNRKEADEKTVDRANNANQQPPPHASPAQGPGPALPPPSGM